ncbi:c7229a68-a515-4841-8233-e2892105e968 [Sclerotinia trifoliorum]|uniref:Autophagy-related protein 14 n=1 Tax=Sclerotinia trifoliorum TaxID=28548 RepID=A0A8H2ZKJ9_9HELO|nr:c7229a68-a515-4841-8233-e2892105e968 [Sclerotinia trifoliorum]
MQCDICFRTGGHKLPFLCPTDARNQLYEFRVQTAGVLVEKDALDREISERFPSPSSKGIKHENEPPLVVTQSNYDALLAEREKIIDRTNQIIAHADELKAKLERAKEERSKKKAANDQRRADLISASSGIEARRTKQIQDIEGSTRRTKYRWNQAYNLIAGSRAYLCYEAAKLYGLQRVKRSTGGEEYKIGGVGIVDLRLMNTASPAQISTSLSHITHVLMLATHYLATRLPAEVTLPHRDYPLPTIFSLASSYLHTNVPFPGGTSSSSNSPSTSRHAENPNQPRPRPLWINKPLPILANEDSAVHTYFLEGAVLLAYNVAWLCKSQGVSVGENGTTSFEDICNIGKNLWKLLIGDKPHLQPTPRSAPLNPSSPKNLDSDGYIEGEDKKNHKVERSLLGWASHGSAYSFLGSAEGAEFIRGFKLPRPNQLADKLKSKLMSEVANAEWEVLSQDAWAMEDEMRSDGVVVGARKEESEAGTPEVKRERDYMAGMQSFMSMRTVMDAVEMVGEVPGINTGIAERLSFGLTHGAKKDRGEGKRDATAAMAKDKDQDKKSGTSGWTKLKPRG